MLNKKDRMAGFTLIEIVAVLLIAVILAAVAISTMGSDSSRVVARADSIRSHLRYAQTKAMTTGALYANLDVWGAVLNNSSYYLFQCGTPGSCAPSGNQVIAPGENAAVIDVGQDGVSISPGGGTIVSFDRFGKPYTDAALTSALGSDLQVTLSDGSGNSRSVTIRPETGMID